MTTDAPPAGDDPRLLTRLRAGDRDAFASVVREHHRSLLGLARTLASANDVEEIVQTAWIKAFQAIAGFEGRSSLRTWLSRIVINEAHTRLRRRGREVFLDDITADGSDPLANRFASDGHWSVPPADWSQGEGPESLLMADQLAECLDQLMTAMPANQRILLEMRDVGGQSFDAICNDLAISASNARVLLHRARQLVFKLVDRYQETGEC
ncbi:MAG: RNA polymerase sigma factor [Porticoccaceae bacterium]